MKRIRIQKRRSRLVFLAATIAASAFVSAFQPASAGTPGGARTQSQQGDFRLDAVVDEYYGYFCYSIWNLRTNEYHSACGGEFGASDDLSSAYGRAAGTWSDWSPGKGRGSKSGGTTKTGSITSDVTWTGTGPPNNQPMAYQDPYSAWCWESTWPYWCFGGYEVDLYQTRDATASGTITDSEWGTFTYSGVPGSLWNQAL